MKCINILVDDETSQRVGTGGMFQIISVEKDDGTDLTQHVDQRKHYHSMEELKKDVLVRRVCVDLPELFCRPQGDRTTRDPGTSLRNSKRLAHRYGAKRALVKAGDASRCGEKGL